MSSALLVLSLLAAVDPVRIGITALLISRSKPIRNLLAFWLGGMAGGIGAALAILLFLRRLTLSLMRVVISSTSSPIAAYVQVAVGVLAVSCAAVLLARRWPHRRPAVAVTAGRLSIRGRLAGGSLLVAFVAGVALATPPAEYMAAILAILASGSGTAAQVAAALVFTLVAFTVVEVPLVTYLTAPAPTLAVVRRMNEWISQRRQAIPAVVFGAVGALLLISGMGKV